MQTQNMISAKYHIYKNARNKQKKQQQQQIYNTVLESGAGPLRKKRPGVLYVWNNLFCCPFLFFEVSKKSNFVKLKIGHKSV